MMGYLASKVFKPQRGTKAQRDIELSGVVHIWKPRNYLMPLLVIAYKDANGLVQACQIRLHGNDISSDEKRVDRLNQSSYSGQC
jgi:hypothetical protein